MPPGRLAIKKEFEKMEKKITPGYYAIIPATVRYDKEVCPNAKLLYGEITALCSKEGYCWATNQYFSDLYGVKPRAISDWVSQLKDAGYLRIQITDRVMRKIFLVEVGENSQGGTRKKSGGVGEKPPHSITANSEKKSDHMSGKPDEAFQSFWMKYPKKELKKKTLEIWKRKNLSEKLPAILDFIERAKKTDRWKKGFVKQPPVFLNNECWDDDLAGYMDEKKEGATSHGSGISEDAKKMIERMKIEREQKEARNEDATNNDALRKASTLVKDLANLKRI